MSKQVRSVTFTVTIEVDADDADALPEVDGFVDPEGHSQVPVSGLHAIAQHLNDGFVRLALEHFYISRIHAYMDDMKFTISDRKKVDHDDDWFY